MCLAAVLTCGVPCAAWGVPLARARPQPQRPHAAAGRVPSRRRLAPRPLPQRDMMHAYFESKAGGYTGAADWGDLCYEVALRTG